MAVNAGRRGIGIPEGACAFSAGTKALVGVNKVYRKQSPFLLMVSGK